VREAPNATRKRKESERTPRYVHSLILLRRKKDGVLKLFLRVLFGRSGGGANE